MFTIKDGSFKSFENGSVKLLAKETKWASLEVRTQHTFLENLISKYDTGPVQLPGLSRNGPQESPIAQWLERPTGIWKVMGSTPVEGSENSFSE